MHGRKLCRLCGEAKPLPDFYRAAKGALGRSTNCIACSRLVQRAYDARRARRKGAADAGQEAVRQVRRDQGA